MTERTPAETVEAVAEFLEADKAMLPDNLTAAQAYAWAIFKVRTVALAFRLSRPRSSQPMTRPLMEGPVEKGGQNLGPSQITERPPGPAPMRPNASKGDE